MKPQALSTFITLLATLLLLPATAAADEPLVQVENRNYALVFYPVVEFNEMILTVTGPCDFQYRQVVDRRGQLFFELDEATIDGNYRFNIMRNEKVDPEIIEILQRARVKLDDETPKRLCREGKLPEPPLSQSSGFRVFRGKIVYDPRAEEEAGFRAGGDETPSVSLAGKAADPFAKDFVINDDLIVDGSACIGFDCVNGESFGFDTIRLKENNLRIKFDDTSVAASFPRNDWQLTANDSANGGADKFSIDDIGGNRTPFTVEANARSHSLYVDDGGRIGSRTSTPSVEIHTIDGDTPTLRLQQDGSSGFAPQTWDVAGNETNFFIRDVTNGSTLPFRIRPQAPTSSIFVDVDGDVGLGTSSPDATLHVKRTDGSITEVMLSTSGGAVDADWKWRANSTTGQLVVQDAVSGDSSFKMSQGAGNNRIVIAANGAVGINTASPNASAALDVDGAIYQRGGVLHADYVFAPDYQLESIDEHAEGMWQERHLPAIPGRMVDERGQEIIEIGSHRRGIVEELEKAHIYIEQLHERLARLEALVKQGAE